jgi:hypothetical protein
MDWNYWLSQKYRLLGQNAAADTTRANAAMVSAQGGANLDNVRAGLLPAESKANIGLTNAQMGLANANARNVDETTKFVGPLARSSIGVNTAQAGNLDADAAFTGQRTESAKRSGLAFSIDDLARMGFHFGALGN